MKRGFMMVEGLIVFAIVVILMGAIVMSVRGNKRHKSYLPALEDNAVESVAVLNPATNWCPAGATDVKDLSNGWFSFVAYDRQFLGYHQPETNGVTQLVKVF